MKANHYAIKIILTLTIISLCLAILGKVGLAWNDFIINILLGIFGSSLVTLILSVINYFVERRKTLETFLICGRKVIKNFRKFPPHPEADEAVKAILEMSGFDYTDFDNTYSEISFINGKALHKRIYNELYAPVVEMRSVISKAASDIERCDNSKIWEKAVESVDVLFNQRTTVETEDGVSITQCERILISSLESNFEGFFYDCIYPKSKDDKGK